MAFLVGEERTYTLAVVAPVAETLTLTLDMLTPSGATESAGQQTVQADPSGVQVQFHYTPHTAGVYRSTLTVADASGVVVNTTTDSFTVVNADGSGAPAPSGLVIGGALGVLLLVALGAAKKI